MSDIAQRVEETLEKYAPVLQEAIHIAKVGMGVKHKRRFGPTMNKVKLTRKGGEVQVMSIGTNKGEIMTHKGKGGSGIRVQKPFINQPAEQVLNDMADEVATISGDVIAFRLIQ